jgi:transcriptional regulator with XRE-family HTH domain
MKKISERLKLLRKEKGLNQEHIAKLLDITRAAYGKIDTGVNDATVQHLVKLSDYYDVSLDWIITGKRAKEETRRFGKHSKTVSKMLDDMETRESLLHAILSLYFGQLERTRTGKRNEIQSRC